MIINNTVLFWFGNIHEADIGKKASKCDNVYETKTLRATKILTKCELVDFLLGLS